MLSTTRSLKATIQAPLKSLNSLLQIPFFLQTTSKSNQDKALKPGDPKWMRFFRPAEPMRIDLERAIKCENIDLLGNYVKANYQSFDFKQLTMVLEPLRNTTIINQLMQEVSLRILTGKTESTPAIAASMLKGGRDIVMKDSMLKKYILLELDTHFEELSHIEKIEALIFMFASNHIQAKKLYSLFDFYKTLDTPEKINEYFDSLARENLFMLLSLFKHLYDSIQAESFYNNIDKRIITGLIRKVEEQFLVQDRTKLKDIFFHFEKFMPNQLPGFYTQEENQRFKKIIAESLYEKYNSKTNLGLYTVKKQQAPTKVLKELFCYKDRFLIEKPCFLISTHLLNKFYEGEKLDYFITNHLAKFGMVDCSYLEEELLIVKNNIKSQLKRSRIEPEHIISTLIKWSIINELNFEESLGSNDNTDKVGIKFVKFDFLRLMEKLLNTVYNEDYLTKIVSFISSSREATPINIAEVGQIVETVEQVKQEISPRSVPNVKGATEDIEIVEEEKGSDPEEVIPEELNNPKEESVEKILSQASEVAAEYEAELKKREYFHLIYFDRPLTSNERAMFVIYFLFVEKLSSLFLLDTISDNFAKDVQIFFQRQEHQVIIDHFISYPEYLESLIMLETLYNSHPLTDKSSPLYPAGLKSKIDAYKQKIDSMMYNYKDESLGLFRHIDSVLAPKLKVSNDLRIELRNELIYSVNKSSIEAIINRHRDQYQKEIDSLNQFDPNLKYKFTNERDFFIKYQDNDENTCLKLAHSKLVRNYANNSHLKKVVARLLEKMNIQYIKNYTDYPCIADFLLFPENQSKIIIQVLDSNKLLLGADQVKSYFTKQCDAYFEAKGYKTIYFKLSDYDIDESAMIERLKLALANTNKIM